MDFWTWFWIALALVLFVVDVVAARLGNRRTLSEHIWGRWFPWVWRRVVFLVFWGFCGVHFAFAGVGWYASGRMVAGWAVILAVIVVERERALKSREDIVGWLKKIGGWLKGAGAWVLRRGPLWSSLLVGASVVVPGAAPILQTIAAAISGASGGEVSTQTVEAFSAVLSGALLLVGAVRKFWALAQPLLTAPAPPAK